MDGRQGGNKKEEYRKQNGKEKKRNGTANEDRVGKKGK